VSGCGKAGLEDVSSEATLRPPVDTPAVDYLKGKDPGRTVTVHAAGGVSAWESEPGPQGLLVESRRYRSMYRVESVQVAAA
jgi:hypothetical protein